MKNSLFKHSRKLAALVAVATLVMTSGAASADQVTLTKNDGSKSVPGDLLGHRSGSYIIATEIGVIAVQVSKVTCSGAACSAGIPEVKGPARWLHVTF